MKKSQQLSSVVCGLLLASTGLAVAGARTVELQRRDEPTLRVHLQPAARLNLDYAAKGAVHFQRRTEPEMRVHLQPAARLNLDYAAKSAVQLQRQAEPEMRVHLQPAARMNVDYAAKSAVRPERRGAVIPRRLSTADGAVDLQFWIFELRSLFSLLP